MSDQKCLRVFPKAMRNIDPYGTHNFSCQRTKPLQGNKLTSRLASFLVDPQAAISQQQQNVDVNLGPAP